MCVVGIGSDRTGWSIVLLGQISIIIIIMKLYSNLENAGDRGRRRQWMRAFCLVQFDRQLYDRMCLYHSILSRPLVVTCLQSENERRLYRGDWNLFVCRVTTVDWTNEAVVERERGEEGSSGYSFALWLIIICNDNINRRYLCIKQGD